MSDLDAHARLSACRWENENRHDPFFAEALDQAAREPALAAWWEAQRALDEVLHGGCANSSSLQGWETNNPPSS